jgi:hypothetical protein
VSAVGRRLRGLRKLEVFNASEVREQAWKELFGEQRKQADSLAARQGPKTGQAGCAHETQSQKSRQEKGGPRSEFQHPLPSLHPLLVAALGHLTELCLSQANDFGWKALHATVGFMRGVKRLSLSSITVQDAGVKEMLNEIHVEDLMAEEEVRSGIEMSAAQMGGLYDFDVISCDVPEPVLSKHLTYLSLNNCHLLRWVQNAPSCTAWRCVVATAAPLVLAAAAGGLCATVLPTCAAAALFSHQHIYTHFCCHSLQRIWLGGSGERAALPARLEACGLSQAGSRQPGASAVEKFPPPAL